MSCSLKPQQICKPAGICKRAFFSIFELGGITEHLMTGPAGNSEFCFPLSWMLRISGKQNSKHSKMIMQIQKVPCTANLFHQRPENLIGSIGVGVKCYLNCLVTNRFKSYPSFHRLATHDPFVYTIAMDTVNRYNK